MAAYVDDVCLGSPDIESHKILLSKLFARLAEVGITVNWSMSLFFATRVPFLGHMVTKHGLETKEDKVRAVTGMPKPSTADELNSQLSMLRFYGRFVPNFSARAAPLRRLLRKGVPWVWGSVEESALLDLRKALTSAPVLCFPDMSLPFSLVCDASKDGFGALLYQTGKGGELCAVSYWNKSTNVHQRNYSSVELELTAISLALKHFSHYLHAQPTVTLITDARTVLYLIRKGPACSSGRMQRQLVDMLSFNLVIKHMPGKLMPADPLSRFPAPPRQHHKFDDDIERDFATLDLDAHTTFESLLRRYGMPSIRSEAYLSVFSMHTPTTREEREAMVMAAHRFGHYGVTRTRAFLTDLGVAPWLTIEEDVKRTCAECSSCARTRAGGTLKLKTAYSVGASAAAPLDVVAVDFTGMPTGSAMTVMDLHSSFLNAFVVPEISGAEVEKVLRRVFATWGVPRKILCDNGAEFANKRIEALCTNFGVKLKFTSPRSPTSNGALERAHGVVKSAMRALIDELPAVDWETHLTHAIHAHNIARSHTTQFSPYALFFGRAPPGFEPLSETATNMRLVANTRRERQRAAYAKRLAETRNNRDGTKIGVGDFVFYRYRNTRGKTTKFTPKFLGPFVILDLPNDLNVTIGDRFGNSKTVHRRQLKRSRGATNLGSDAIPLGHRGKRFSRDRRRALARLNALSADVAAASAAANTSGKFHVNFILDHRKSRDYVGQEFLVVWSGWGEDDASWVHARELEGVVRNDGLAHVDAYWQAIGGKLPDDDDGDDDDDDVDLV